MNYIVIYNPIGAIMCIVPAVLVSFAWVYSQDSTQDWTLIGAWGAVAFIWDILYRVFKRDVHWLNPKRGGHVFFIPVYFLAAGALWWYVNHALTLGYWLPHTKS